MQQNTYLKTPVCHQANNSEKTKQIADEREQIIEDVGNTTDDEAFHEEYKNMNKNQRAKKPHKKRRKRACERDGVQKLGCQRPLGRNTQPEKGTCIQPVHVQNTRMQKDESRRQSTGSSKLLRNA